MSIHYMLLNQNYFVVYGLVIVGMETADNLPFFYGKSQSGGSNANGSFIIGLGTAMFSHHILIGLISSIVACFLALLVRIFTAKFLNRKNSPKG